MTTFAWVNGRVVPADEPVLLTNDHGLTVGDGVFETAKIVRGEVLRVAFHRGGDQQRVEQLVLIAHMLAEQSAGGFLGR